jgi:hypothetical protein
MGGDRGVPDAARLRGPWPGQATAGTAAPRRVPTRREPAQGARRWVRIALRKPRSCVAAFAHVAFMHILAPLCQMGTRKDDSLGIRVAFGRCPPPRIQRVTQARGGDERRRRGFRTARAMSIFGQLGKPLIDALRGESSIEDHFGCTGQNRGATPSPLVGAAMDLIAGA